MIGAGAPGPVVERFDLRLGHHHVTAEITYGDAFVVIPVGAEHHPATRRPAQLRMVHTVALTVDRPLLEAESFDQEGDQARGSRARNVGQTEGGGSERGSVIGSSV